jgi:glycosyltransferase involved in cell wall biosynthesis/SAM-dependent methyltransferase
LADALESPMTSSRLPHGVNVAGYFKAEAGVGQAARLLVETLRAADVPYALVPYTATVSRQNVSFDYESGAQRLYDTTVVCVNADEFAPFVTKTDPALFSGRHVIAMWWWEVERFPERLAQVARLVDEVWVGSRHTADAIAPEVEVPVSVFPPPIMRPTAAAASRGDLGLPDDYLFMFAFDFLSVFERKNPLAIVDAFTRAFASNEGASLVLRTLNGERRPHELARLRAAVAGRPDIRVVDGFLDAEIQYALVASCDAYVSLHRAEGFAFTVAEAMALGKPVIATAYSGNLEFMNEQNSYLVPYRLVQIGPGSAPYPPDARWAEPDVDEAARLMRRVFEDPEEGRTVGARALADVEAKHSPAARAEAVRSRLAEIATREPAAASPRRALASQLASRAHIVGQLPPLERARVYVAEGPNLVETTRGWIRRVYRSLVLAATRHYRHYEQNVAEALVEVSSRQFDELEELRRRVSREYDGVAAPVDGVPRWTAKGDGDGRVRYGVFVRPEGGALRNAIAGTEHAIRERSRFYLPLLPRSEIVLDVACGRGELLDLLAEAGAYAQGADTDAAAVARAREKGHQVEVLEPELFLAGHADASVGAVVARGLVERMSLEPLTSFLSLAALKLRGGGLLVVEAMNPHSFAVLRAVWRDPAAAHPVFPEALVVLLRDLGFAEARVVFPRGTGELERDRRDQREYAVVARSSGANLGR